MAIGNLQLASGVEVLKRNSEALRHGLLTLANPDTGVVVLLVWLVVTVWVTDLGLDVILLVLNIVSDTGKVGPLEISIQVDLDHTI